MTALEARTVDVKGRTVAVKPLNDAQLIMVARDAELLQRDDIENSRKLKTAGYIMDTLESAIATEDDRDYILQLTRRGELNLTDMLGFLQVAHSGDVEVAPKKVVKRGRPRKAQ